MRTELPKKWCIKNENDCLKSYASKIKNNSWDCDSEGSYYFYKNGVFDFSGWRPKNYEEITLEEFKILVLGEKQQQPTEPQYEIY